TAIGKYWICKRAPGYVYEAMAFIGGSSNVPAVLLGRWR
ncbi:MAG: hypothetical protein ACI9T9_002807, partial [Oleiphilaceae bacterium]